MEVILSTAYLGPVQYYSKLANYPAVTIEYYEHFRKQTYRNRCSIYGANGKLDLIIPLSQRKDKTLTKDIRIDYTYHWQKLHWRSLEAGYRRSPFFEFYEDRFLPFYETRQYEFLVDFNDAIQATLLSLLKLSVSIHKTNSYVKIIENGEDFRDTLSPKNDYKTDKTFILQPYLQPFENKFGFIENLSIVDVLFNQGPGATAYLHETFNGTAENR